MKRRHRRGVCNDRFKVRITRLEVEFTRDTTAAGVVPIVAGMVAIVTIGAFYSTRESDMKNVIAKALLVSTIVFASSFANAQSMSSDELAAEIQQQLFLMPNAPETPITAIARDGRIELSGTVESSTIKTEIDQILQDIEGLDMEIIDNNITIE